MPAALRGLRTSWFVKVAWIAGVVVVLWIPLVLERGVLDERQARRDVAAFEVARAWGERQMVGGPVLAVPYRTAVRVEGADGVATTTTAESTAYFLPEDLEVTGELVPETRRRGIFELVVYRAELKLAGTFAAPELEGWPVRPEGLDWASARLRIGVSDVRGLRAARIIVDGDDRPVESAGAVAGLWEQGIAAPLAAGPGGPRRFSVALSLVGTESFEVLPLARTARASLSAPWPDPSFYGSFLPETSEVGTEGFTARWSVSDLAHGQPRRWREGELASRPGRPAPRASVEEGEAMAGAGGGLRGGLPSLGVGLYRPVDHYQKTERSMKYALLFLLLTFVTFFLHELTGRAALHPMHYLLVGSALVLFYLLLLSLSEHVPFGYAYLVAAAAVVVEVTAYSRAVLGERRRALTLGLVMAALYGYFWVLLAAEDWALVLGTAGLFLILGLVMYLTRRVDWSAPGDGIAGAPPAGAATGGGP